MSTRSVDQLVRDIDEEAAVAFLAEMIGFKSYSDTPGETALAEFMASRMEALGLETELQPVEGTRRNAIGRWPGTGGGASLLFNGHLDTNPATEGWTVDPWGGEVREGCIYGIGVSNMKAGDAAYFQAVKSLIDQGVRLRGDVVLTFVVGELQGGVGSVKAIEAGIRADHFINSEPTDLTALTLHAGSFNFVIELTGDTRHCSKREEAVDALAAAAELVPRLNAMTFSGARGEDHEAVNRCHVGVLRAALSTELHEWRPPQVADFARITGTARYAPSQSEASVLADLERALASLAEARPGLAWRVYPSHVDGRPAMLPFEVARDAPIVRSLNRAYRSLRGRDQETGPVGPPRFYGTDAAHFLHRAGMEGVVCGPGGKYNTMPDERVEIADYLDMIRIYKAVLLDICGHDT